MKFEIEEPRSPLEKSWGSYIDLHANKIRVSLLKAIESASETNAGFIVVKKDRSGGYRIEHKQWIDVMETLRELGAIGGYIDGNKKRGN